MLRKILKHCATNTDSTDRIARGYKTFLKIKLTKEKGKGYVYLENTAIFLENDYKLEHVLKILVGNYKIFFNICRNYIPNIYY